MLFEVASTIALVVVFFIFIFSYLLLYIFSILAICYSELYCFRPVLLTHHFCTVLMLLSISSINNSSRNVFNCLNFSLNTLFSTVQYQQWIRLLLSKCAIKLKIVVQIVMCIYNC